MRKGLCVILVLALALCMGACQSAPGAEKKELVIFTWSDYLPQETLDAFTAETGIEVIYTYFDSNDEMLTKLDAVDGGEYDLVLASDYAIDIARKQGLTQKLDKSVITRFGDIDPVFQSKFFDPDNEYTVPFAAGTPLIVYDPAKVSIDITGYESLWDPSLEDSIVLIDDARVILGVTLISMGYTMNETDPEIIQAAGDKLLQMKGNIRALDYNTPHELMISGETAVGFMFTPQAYWAITERPDLEICYPKEGMGFGIDAFFIPSNAPHAEEANLFLNYILDGETSAYLSEFTQYMNCVTTAKEYLPESYFNEVLYIPDEVLGNTQFVEDVGTEAQSLYADQWTRFKNES